MKLSQGAQLPKSSQVTKLLRENYVDIHKQAERISTSQLPTRETLVNVRYSHIPVNPGVPMGYSKEEPTFSHYKEINEQMLYVPGAGKDFTSSSKTPDRARSQNLNPKRQVNYSNLRYSVEDVQLNFKNDKTTQSRETMKNRMSTLFEGRQSQNTYDTSRLSSAPFQTNVFGKVLSNLQNSRIEVRFSTIFFL